MESVNWGFEDIEEVDGEEGSGDYENLVAKYLSEVSWFKLLSKEEEQEICRGLEECSRLGDEVGYRRYRDRMLEGNLRLVIYVAKRYVDKGMDFLDLIQEGNIGLMKALERYEYRRGLKFVTYAHWWVRQSISRGLIDKTHVVRRPSHVVEKLQKLRRTERGFWDAHGREPTLEDLSEETGWSSSEVAFLKGLMERTFLLTESVNDADGRPLRDRLIDGVMLPDEQVMKGEFEEAVSACLSTLPEREELILRLRHGFGDAHPHTLGEIAAILGLSRERVRQVESIALEKLGKRWSLGKHRRI